MSGFGPPSVDGLEGGRYVEGKPLSGARFRVCGGWGLGEKWQAGLQGRSSAREQAQEHHLILTVYTQL